MLSMDSDQMLDKARKAIAKLPINETFVVKNLFIGTEWNDLSANDQRAFGRLFSRKYKEGKIKGIVKVENNKAHHAQYKKINEGTQNEAVSKA